MEILHLINTIDRGGAENHLSCLARGQKKKLNKIHIIYLKGNDYWNDYFINQGIRVTKIKKSSKHNFIYQIKYIKNYIKKNNIEILHAHLPYMEILGYFSILFNKKIKFFVTKHVDNNFLGGSIKRTHSIFADFLDLIILKRCKKVIAISHAVKNYLTRNIFFNFKKKIKVIYYGIDENYIQTCLNQNSNTQLEAFIKSPDDIVFGFVGRLVKQKQVELVINSFFELKKKTKKEVKLLIVGDGPEKQKLEELTSRLNLSKNIFFIKHQNKVGEVIKLIDIFCMNSKFEGLGLIMLEVMYFSKPIIAPSISAIPEVVKNEINGLIVKSNDIYAYSNAMLKFISEDYRRQNSMNSKYILNKKFNFNIMIEKTINLYKE